MASPTPVSRYMTQNSKKRMFAAESSSSGDGEVDVSELSPETDRASKPKSSKQKEVVCHEIIDVDIDEEGGEAIFTGSEADRRAKGKEVLSISYGGLNNVESESDTLTSKNGVASHDSTNVDDLSSDYGEDEEETDTYDDDMMYEVEEDYPSLESQFDNIDIPPGVEVSFPWLSGPAKDDTNVQSSSSTSTHDSTKLKPLKVNPSPISNSSDLWDNPTSDVEMDASEGGSHMPVWQDIFNGFQPFKKVLHIGKGQSSLSASKFTIDYDPFVGLGQDPADNLIGASPVGTSLPTKTEPVNVEQINFVEALNNFHNFKKFDIVEDFSDHHYTNKGSTAKQPPKNWAKRIQEEWKILEKDLPDEVFVRVYESRMDLLRAVIIGAEGTPYHDGLFFFDVFFPSTYPNVPPHVHYHSRGLRINPNLYNCGKVCLSLLNTWTGSQKEKWIPGVSTMLQVLVSIQGLILNAEPFYNEPGYADMGGTENGKKRSLEYNERTFIYNLQTMVYNIRRPPKHFEDFSVGYFCEKGRSILVSCKAYLDGARVGYLVKGNVQVVDEDGKKNCSQEFKSSLGVFMATLTNQFLKIGAAGCEEFTYLIQHAIPAPSVAQGPLQLGLLG